MSIGVSRGLFDDVDDSKLKCTEKENMMSVLCFLCVWRGCANVCCYDVTLTLGRGMLLV